MNNFTKSNKRIIKSNDYSYKNNDVIKEALPVIEQINHSDILFIYDIVNINDISKMDLSRMTLVNILLNCWIKVNNNKLKDNEKYLSKIYTNIIEINNLIVNKNNLEKNVEKYVNYWISNFKLDKVIRINLLEDLIHHLEKKSKE
jgi:hypothetical protein